MTINTTYSYHAITCVDTWYQESLGASIHPVAKLGINAITLICYVITAGFSIAELIVQIVFDIFRSIISLTPTLKKSIQAYNSCYCSAALIFYLFRYGAARLQDLQ